MRSLVLLLIALSSIATAVPTRAAPAMPQPGTRVRVSSLAFEANRWTGPFVSLARDTVTLREGDASGALVIVPALQVSRFETSRGSLRNGLRGAGVGFALGALLGAGVESAHHKDDEFVSSRAQDATAGAVVFGVVGAVVGSAIGALTRSERWRTLSLENLRGTAGR